MCGFVIRNIHADGSDYKSDSFITPDCKSGVTMTSLLRAVFSCCHDKKMSFCTACETSSKNLSLTLQNDKKKTKRRMLMSTNLQKNVDKCNHPSPYGTKKQRLCPGRKTRPPVAGNTGGHGGRRGRTAPYRRAPSASRAWASISARERLIVTIYTPPNIKRTESTFTQLNVSMPQHIATMHATTGCT